MELEVKDVFVILISIREVHRKNWPLVSPVKFYNQNTINKGG